ncbi:hypothetical protein PseudUWO310_00635 [Pseudanabaena sp. UWO310]|nr:hypothetical protein PseudUWO310_00635 [Pseudanabaena sp. UWO310]
MRHRFYIGILELGQIKPQELTGGASRRQSILGVYVLVQLATAILFTFCQFNFNNYSKKSCVIASTSKTEIAKGDLATPSSLVRFTNR